MNKRIFPEIKVEIPVSKPVREILLSLMRSGIGALTVELKDEDSSAISISGLLSSECATGPTKRIAYIQRVNLLEKAMDVLEEIIATTMKEEEKQCREKYDVERDCEDNEELPF